MSRNKRNMKGVTLVEVMIALTIMLVVFMGLIQASLLSIRHNLRNEIRDEAVRLASEEMAQARSMGFDPLVSAATLNVNRTFRNTQITYAVTRTVTVLDPNNKQVQIAVNWTDLADNTPLSHTIRSSVRRILP